MNLLIDPEIEAADRVSREFLDRVEAERRQRSDALRMERSRKAQAPIVTAIRVAPCE